MTNHEMNKSQTPRQPFWNPWGAGGCLWRTVLFLLGLCLICFLLAFLYRMDRDEQPSDWWKEKVATPVKGERSVKDPFRDYRDETPVPGWNDSIPGVAELPPPQDNYLPPVDSTSIIVNPEDSVSYMVEDQLVILFNSTDIKEDMASFARQYKQIYPGSGYEVLYYNPAAGIMLLGVPQEQLFAVADELPERIKGIDFVVATNDMFAEAASSPSDPGFLEDKYDEYFNLIQAYDAWEVTKGSDDVVVGIVDSYFVLSHPELSGRAKNPIHIPSKTANVFPPPYPPSDENELSCYCHGSHVAGIAIGAQDNGVGCSGIAPECTWIPVSLGSSPFSSIALIEGILYAVYQGADVINFSIGKDFPKEAKHIPLEDQAECAQLSNKRGELLWEYVAKIANDHRCVLVTSAGNSTVLMGLDPKNRSNAMIKVEAVDGRGQKADFSNFGKVPEEGLDYSTVSAPGVNLWSVTDKRCVPFWKSEGYVASAEEGLQEMSGTSMAAPVVTGAVALLKSKKKNLTTEQVIDILTLTAKQFDKEHRIGPTIQMKDALDMTGGEALNFDDLMKNHKLLIGKWKSTNELVLIGSDGERKEKLWDYFIFTSTEEGYVEIHGIDSKRVYTAPLKVQWGKDSITITQLNDARSEDGQVINKDDFVCRPNQQRLLETSALRNGKLRFTFLLEKVK